MKTGRGSPMDFEATMLLRWGADYGPLTLDGQFWRIFTSMFVHGGLIHVAANMWCLWNFGPLAERVYGRWRFLTIYLLTGLASSVSSLAIHPTTISVGASGAIFGIVGALVFPFYRKRLQLPPQVMKSMMSSLLTFIVINLLIGSAVPVIDNAAHVGGLLAGLLLGAVITQVAIYGRTPRRSISEDRGRGSDRDRICVRRCAASLSRSHTCCTVALRVGPGQHPVCIRAG